MSSTNVTDISKRKAANRKYYLANALRLRTKSAIWRRLHMEYNKQYWNENKERINAQRKDKRLRLRDRGGEAEREAGI